MPTIKNKITIEDEVYSTCYAKKIKIGKELNNYLKHELLLKREKLEKYNNTLAGNIVEEYVLPEELNDIVAQISMEAVMQFEFDPNYGTIQRQRTGSMASKFMEEETEFMVNSWVNFQKKHEFNPLHNHSGKYSFVLWIQVPYNFEDEMNLDNCKYSNAPSNSKFEFVMSNPFGEISQVHFPVDKTWEGTMVVFPANLKHCVYPFYTSDDYRISVAGNIFRIPKNYNYENERSQKFDFETV